ncbi:hypothetical protein EXIGUO8H_120003 [Exiguobacterium sp. 8H]|uniref:NosD domain-containing protein n=1 Tax=unclassified Exiguobacterium TaxID=2644629 RepID=UPI0012F0EB1E|nr:MULTISPECIES: NosD domain-containing protein [unclassified Exiguobacterium]VXB37899.1 hypothetical protein EXIGUO8H_120003 [Exiguobacterium sp. 8H]VXB99436.1 hypothetical protein EXIGUO8A_590003 [Exiguobacterium sp. 8A]
MSHVYTGTPAVVNGFISVLDPAVRQNLTGSDTIQEIPDNDFTNTFDACLAYASEHKLNVFVPAGLYLVRRIALRRNVTIQGVGAESDIRHLTEFGVYKPLFYNPKTDKITDTTGSIDRAHIKDLRVRLSAFTNYGFHLDQVYDTVISRVHVLANGCKGRAFHVTGGAGEAFGQGTAYYNTFYDVVVNGGNNGGYLEAGFVFHHSANSNRVQNCRVIGGNTGVMVETGYTNHIHVTGCAFERVRYGVNLTGAAFCTVSGNRFELNEDDEDAFIAAGVGYAGIRLGTYAGELPGKGVVKLVSRDNFIAGNFFSGFEINRKNTLIMDGPENEMNQVLDKRRIHTSFIYSGIERADNGTPKNDLVDVGWLSDANFRNNHSIRNAKSIQDTKMIQNTGTIHDVDLLTDVRSVTNVDAITGVGTMSDVESLTNVTEIRDVDTISSVSSITDVGSIQLTRLTAEPVVPVEGTLYHLDTATHPEGYYLYRNGGFRALVPEPTGPVVPTAPDHPFFQLDARTLFRDGVWEYDLHGWSSLERQVVSDPSGEPVVTFHSIPAWGLLADGMTIDARKLKCLRLRAPKGEAYYRIAVKAYDRDGFQLEDTGATEAYVHLHGAVASETSYWNETQKRRQNRANVYEATLRVLSDEVFFLKVSIFTGVAITTENPITSLVLEVPAATTAEALAAETLSGTVFKNPLFDGSLAPQG